MSERHDVSTHPRPAGDDPAGVSAAHRDLRRLFAAARRADASRAPAFDRLWPSGRRSHAERGWRRRLPDLRLAAATGGLAVVILGLALWPWASTPAPPAQAVTVSIDWQGPTDFLLDIDGELLSTLPTIGVPPALPGADLDAK